MDNLHLHHRMPLPLFFTIIITTIILLTPPSPALGLHHHNDTHALTLFRLQADLHGHLLPNWTGGDACSAAWHGVACSPNNRVTSLSLPSLNLRGPLTPLSFLTHLRFLDLHDNRLNGTVAPLLSNCTNLRLLYLSGNDLSGEIPPEISAVKGLLRLDLSGNNLGGKVLIEH